MITMLGNRSPDIRVLNTIKARVSGVFLRDFARQGRRRSDTSDRRKRIPGGRAVEGNFFELCSHLKDPCLRRDDFGWGLGLAGLFFEGGRGYFFEVA